MNRFPYLLVALLMAIAPNLYSQLNFLPYLAKDSQALKAVENSIKSTKLTDAELLLVGTGEVPNMPISVTIDIDKGTSTVWVYVYKSYKLDSIISYAVIRTLLGYTSLPIPASYIFGNLPFTPDSSLKNAIWMNSDKVMDSLKVNSRYSKFKKDRPDMKLQMVGVGVNSIMPLMDLNTAYWMVSFTSGGGDLTCFVQAETGKTTCLGTWGVDNNNSDGGQLTLYPNPASDYIYLNIPLELQNSASTLTVSDVYGRKIQDLYPPRFGETTKVQISLATFSSGVYFLRYSNNIKNYVIPFVIDK